MKHLLFILCVFSVVTVFSQPDDYSVCWVTAVKGAIRKPCDALLKTGDTIMFRDVRSLKYGSENCQVILRHPRLGSFRLSPAEVKSLSGHESFTDFIAHLVKIKGTKISLSSRGGCECSAAKSCFFTDTLLNDKTLLIDSLSFMADDALMTADRGYYYLQKDIGGGKVLTNKLQMSNGVVSIRPRDLVFKDNEDTAVETQLVLCLFTMKDGARKSEFVSYVKFGIVSTSQLQEYYSTLQQAMKGADLSKVYDDFCQDVYMYFGKPNECQLNKIVNNAN